MSLPTLPTAALDTARSSNVVKPSILGYRMKANEDVPIILGRPFLATEQTMIDVDAGELTMRVNDQSITFSIYPPGGRMHCSCDSCVD